MISPIHSWVAERTGLQQKLDPETLSNWQNEKLKVLIEYARKNSKFYKEKLSNATFAILTELPFTSPTDIAQDPLAFLAIPQSEVAKVTTLANSGTTRLKKRIFFSTSDLERIVDFFAVGMSTMVSKGEHAQILLSIKTENGLGDLLVKGLSRIGVSSEITGAINTVDSAIKASKNSDCLIGMPAEIYYMSCIDTSLRPKTVLLTADYVPQSLINNIKKNWKCKVFSHYGHTEFGYGCAVDCEQHNGYHLRNADLIFEIIDPNSGKPVADGESGEIVITTLNNQAMPLIRYRTGNISSMIKESCKCGCKLHRLGKIKGRIESNISIENGKILSIHQLDEIVFAEASVRAFNASLTQAGKITTLYLTIDTNQSINFDFPTEKLPQGTNVEIMYKNADPFIRRGKRRIQSSTSTVKYVL